MKETLLITVKAYPEESKKYGETVCTAAVNEKGEWRRIYPVPLRTLPDEQQYHKYQWIEADLEKSSQDKRPESRRVADPDNLLILGEPLNTDNGWRERRANFIDKVEIHNDLTKLIKLAHRNKLSLALFRPTKWCNLKIEKSKRQQKIKPVGVQSSLLADDKQVISISPLPHDFSYRFEDVNGKQSTLMITDWELGALYANCLGAANNNHKEAQNKVSQKYWQSFIKDEKKETLLILGTLHKYHQMTAPNPFVIVGVVPLLKEEPTLF